MRPGAPEDQAREAVATLAERFSGTLQFGTAGLRAAIGAGPMGMNRAVVQLAAAGVAAHVLAVAGDEPAPKAVIGFDARHRSADFARDTAAVLTAARSVVDPGGRVHVIFQPHLFSRTRHQARAQSRSAHGGCSSR